jgi:hypothetical protein
MLHLRPVCQLGQPSDKQSGRDHVLPLWMDVCGGRGVDRPGAVYWSFSFRKWENIQNFAQHEKHCACMLYVVMGCHAENLGSLVDVYASRISETRISGIACHHPESTSWVAHLYETNPTF